jgi:hypothetical protein
VLRDNINTNKKKEALNYSGKEVGPQVNTEKTKYCVHVLSPECRARSKHKSTLYIL